jgi:hypothetical protein
MFFLKRLLPVLLTLVAMPAAAQVPISGLPSASLPLCAEYVPVVQSGATKKAPACALGIPYVGSSTPTALSIYQAWWDTSVSPRQLKYYDGAQWVVAGQLDSASHLFQLPPGVVDTDPTLNADSNLRLPSQQAVKSYVDNSAAGLVWHTAAKVATTANITLSGEQTIDGVLTSANRVLVNKQTTASQNGIYVSASGAWSRATDADTAGELVNAAILVTNGTANGGTQWSCGCTALTLGTSAITFAQISVSGTYTAGTGLALSANQFSIDSTVATLTGTQTLTNKSIDAAQLTGTINNARLDAELSAIAGLTSAADQLPYFTGSGTAALTTLTSTARTLLDDTSTSAMRTTLGLAIGTNVEAWDADLDALAGLSATAGILKRTGAGAFGLAAAGTDFMAATAVSTNVLLKSDGAGGTSAYAGSSCGTAQLPSAASNTGAWTCSSFPLAGAYFANQGTTTTVLHGNAAGNPSWGAVSLTADVSGILAVAEGGTNASTAAAARTNLGLAIGTNVEAQSADLDCLAALATTGPLKRTGSGTCSAAALSLTADVTGTLPGANGGTGNAFFAVSGPATSLKTFTLPNATANILTDNAAVTVLQGGTGSSTASGARSNLSAAQSGANADITALGALGNGSCPTPSVAFNTNYGLVYDATNGGVGVCSAGTEIGYFSNVSTFSFPGAAAGWIVQSDNATSIQAASYITSPSTALFVMHKGRGTIASPAVPVTNDPLGTLRFAGWTTGTSFGVGAEINTLVREATWGASALGSRVRITTAKLGGTTLNEVVSFDADNGETLTGDFHTAGSAPSISSCGTSPSVRSGSTDTAGEITTGTGSPVACTISFTATKTNAPFCTVTMQTSAHMTAYAISTTAISLTINGTGADKVDYSCTQHP